VATDAHLVDARVEHVEELVAHSRREQLEECRQTGRDLGEVTRTAIERSSVAWSLFFGGRLAAIGGAIPLPGAQLRPDHFVWVATTTVVLEHPLRFVRWSLKLLPLFEQLGWLKTEVSVSFIESVRWLAWLGFRFDQPDASGFIPCWRGA
jgi:hypothetical protein